MAEYSKLDQWAHRLALGCPVVAETSLMLERAMCGQQTPVPALVVTGLARAGTTTLMRALHNSQAFASLTYNDMPYVLCPNVWSKLVALHPRKIALHERAHGDGIEVFNESPEALEEVFWRVHCASRYIKPDCLLKHQVEADTVHVLLQYQALVCKRYGKSRYLAKNNNTVLRLASLAPQTPNTTYLVMYRHPLAQAKSLHKQHQRFAQADAFTRQYMGWLVHHEFGADHRPFVFNPSQQPSTTSPPSGLTYWLDRWIDVYEHLLTVLDMNLPNVLLVGYEQLCTNRQLWAHLSQHLDLPPTAPAFTNKNPVQDWPSSPNLSRALEVYHALEQLAERFGNTG